MSGNAPATQKKIASRAWEDASPPLTPWVLEAVKSFGFTQMTPVQASVLPLFSGNKDVVVEAVTGSGKTLAFLIPLIERIIKLNENVRAGYMNAIVISPTRELAEQIHTVLRSLFDFIPEDSPRLRSQLLIGGDTPVHTDLKNFLSSKPHILVATPGRLIELLKANQVKTSALDALVLDEADRLLDLGFDRSINALFNLLPKQRRTGLFSATITDAVGQLVRVGLRNPVKVVVKVTSAGNEQRTPSTLGIHYAKVVPSQKLPLLINLITNGDETTFPYRKAIVYFPTCIGVTYYHSLINDLLKEKYPDSDVEIFSMHGKLPSGPRRKTLGRFTSTVKQAILFTTDVAARGLDIPEVDLVFQLDPPTEPSAFLHRSGRAGRAGRTGHGIVFLHTGREEDFVDFMEVKKVHMSEYLFEEEQVKDDHSEFVRKWILEDRNRHDQALRSFVSFIRFYTKHTATSIFRLPNLDLVALAKAYGLLRLPKMPELKTVPEADMPEGGWLGEKIDMDNYKYTNPQKESARLEDLEAHKQQVLDKKKRDFVKISNDAWSAKAERKEIREERRTKRQTRVQAKAIADAAESSDSEAEVDWKELVQQKKKKQKDVASFADL